MRYQVLVADDEAIIRRGIVKLLGRFEELEVVAEAEDGEQALEIAKQTKLDILFVDINMPFINGLQFIEGLKEIQPNAIVNIISGYDKFEYVRQALRLRVFEYILKPLNEAAFIEIIHKILDTLSRRQEEEGYLGWGKAALDQNKSKLIGEFLDKCIHQKRSEDRIKDEIRYFIKDLPEQYAMHLLCFDRIEIPDLRQYWSNSLLYASAENITREMFHRLSPFILFCNSRGYLVLICKAESKHVLEGMLEELTTTIEKYIPTKVLLLWRIGDDCYQIHHIYQELMDRMEEQKAYPKIINKMKEYILDNYYKEDISLLELAQYSNLSPQHVSRIFKKEIGITFVDYLTQVRLKKAIELFADEELKMYEIAEKVGYTTQHYFSSVFKKAFGISPIEYRNRSKNEVDYIISGDGPRLLGGG